MRGVLEIPPTAAGISRTLFLQRPPMMGGCPRKACSVWFVTLFCLLFLCLFVCLLVSLFCFHYLFACFFCFFFCCCCFFASLLLYDACDCHTHTHLSREDSLFLLLLLLLPPLPPPPQLQICSMHVAAKKLPMQPLRLNRAVQRSAHYPLLPSLQL